MSNQMDLSKTLLFDHAWESGEEVLHKTLAKNTKSVSKEIMADFTNMLNQAGFSGASVKETIHIARLAGYLNELSLAFEMMTRCGFSFSSKKNPNGSLELRAELKLKGAS